MSVVFSPEPKHDIAHILVCFCGDFSDGVVYGTFKEASDASRSAVNSCEDIYCDVVYVEPAVREPEVQMANVNASELLDVLGIQVGEDFSDRCGGSLSGEDFLGRVLMAEAVSPVDAGVPVTRSGANNNFVDCGRPAGYTQAKLAGLREVSDWAITNNRRVVWG